MLDSVRLFPAEKENFCLPEDSEEHEEVTRRRSSYLANA